MKAKGILIYYLNRDTFTHLGSEEKILETLVKANQLLIKQSEESGHPVLFVPCVHEATRIEKIDFDKPFPLGEETCQE